MNSQLTKCQARVLDWVQGSDFQRQAAIVVDGRRKGRGPLRLIRAKTRHASAPRSAKRGRRIYGLLGYRPSIRPYLFLICYCVCVLCVLGVGLCVCVFEGCGFVGLYFVRLWVIPPLSPPGGSLVSSTPPPPCQSGRQNEESSLRHPGVQK